MQIRLLVLVLGISMSTMGNAQILKIKRDTLVSKAEDNYKIISNRFFDNWFLGITAGAQIYYGDHNKQAELADRLTPYLQGFLGKWFSPGIGVRLGLDGFKIKGLTQNGSYTTGERYDKIPWEGYWLSKQEFKYWHLRADVLYNLTNIILGYKSDRFYNLSPYVGLGWMMVNETERQRELSANLGLFNTLCLTNGLDLTLDIRGAMMNDRFDGEIGGRRNEGQLSGSLGLIYRFKKRDWDKPYNISVTESYDQAALDKVLNRLKQLELDNEELRKLLLQAKDSSITDVIMQKDILAAPILITFPINKSTVSNEAKVNLGFFADIINTGGKEFTYTITGYADKGTGSFEVNERLSRERADAVYKVLVNEFDVNPNQLRRYHKGGVENMFYDDPRLSRAVITIADRFLK